MEPKALLAVSRKKVGRRRGYFSVSPHDASLDNRMFKNHTAACLPLPQSYEEHAPGLGIPSPRPAGIIYGALGLNKESILLEETVMCSKNFIFLHLVYEPSLVSVPRCE